MAALVTLHPSSDRARSLSSGRVLVVLGISAVSLNGVWLSACQRRASEPAIARQTSRIRVTPELASTEVISEIPTYASEKSEPAPKSGSPPARQRPPTQGEATAFSVYALSRGKGVPPEARLALGQIRAFVEADQIRGVAVTFNTDRIGLEGETRLCVEYKNPDSGRRALERARSLVNGVDLVRLIVEPCEITERPRKDETQEGEQ